MNHIITYFIGFDYHKNTVFAYILDENRNFIARANLENRKIEILKFIAKHIPQGARIKAVVEACGGAVEFAHQMNAAGIPTLLAHPGAANRMKYGKDKTDSQDAKLLAELLACDHIQRVWLPPKWISELRALTRHRFMLRQEQVELNQRIQALCREAHLVCPYKYHEMSKAWKDWLLNEAELTGVRRFIITNNLAMMAKYASLEKACLREIQNFVGENKTFVQLMSYKRIGLITAAMLLAEVGDFTRFRSGKAFANFCGMSPLNVSSGLKQSTGGIIANGSRRLRKILIEIFQQFAMFVPEFRAKVDAMVRRGIKWNKAIVANGNRWLRRLYHEMCEFQRLPGNAIGDTP